MTSPAEERQQFKIGEDVQVTLIGTIKGVEQSGSGLRYVIENTSNGYERCYVKQSQMSRLPEPNDFGIPDLPEEKEASNGN